MRRKPDASRRLRRAVESMPRHTREAMLRGIERNRIIVGAYVDKRGGVCPMLAAHRNGGRTNFATFAKAWDRFTSAGRKSRRASRREVRALRGYLELSLLRDELGGESLAEVACELRERRRARRLRRSAGRASAWLGRRPEREEIRARATRPRPAPRQGAGTSSPAPRSSARS